MWRQKEEPELDSEETAEETPEAKRFIAKMDTLHFRQVQARQIVPAGELAYVLPGAYAHLPKHHQRRVSGQSVVVTRALGSEEEEVHVKSAIELTNARTNGRITDPSCKVARANVWVKVYAEDLDDAIERSRRVSGRAKKGPLAYSPDEKLSCTKALRLPSTKYIRAAEAKRQVAKAKRQLDETTAAANKLQKKLEVAEAANQRLMRRNFSLKEDFGSAQDARYQRSAVCKV